MSAVMTPLAPLSLRGGLSNRLVGVGGSRCLEAYILSEILRPDDIGSQNDSNEAHPQNDRFHQSHQWYCTPGLRNGLVQYTSTIVLNEE